MAHIHELYDFTVSAFIVHQDKLLLLHHKKLNKWLQPGGHIELDEDPIQALWREIEEETGLKEKDIELVNLAPRVFDSNEHEKELAIPFNFNVHDFNDSHKHIDLNYLMRARHNRYIHNKEESNDIRWFSSDEIKRLDTLPSVKEKALFAIEYLVHKS